MATNDDSLAYNEMMKTSGLMSQTINPTNAGASTARRSASEKQWKKLDFKKKVIDKYLERKKGQQFVVAGKDINLSEYTEPKLLALVRNELKKSETDLGERIKDFPVVNKAYLDMEKNPDPFYVDYNLLYANVDLMMAMSWSNTMKVIFTGTNEADLVNADIITKTANYDYKYEMDMSVNEYIANMDKFKHGVGIYVFDGWKAKNNAPKVIIANVEYRRPDPKGHTEESKFRWMGFYSWMTKQDMRNAGFINIDEVKQTDEQTSKEKSDKQVGDSKDQVDDESALFQVYNHFRTDKDGNKQLITTSDGCKTLHRAIQLDYKIGGRKVFNISLDYRRPEVDNPYGIRPYDLSGRKQNALSLLLNLGLKKSIRSSLGNHILVDKDAVVNKNDLKQLSEFPEIIIVDTHKGQISLDNSARELTRSQVPQDNFNMFNQLETLNQIETAIGSNQMGISPAGEQTAEEIRNNAGNANMRLGLMNKISSTFYQDFRQKRYMMYLYHFPEGAQKLVIISNDYGDRYMTFTDKNLNLSQDPHITIVSKLEQDLKNKQHLANHIAIHTYIDQFSQTLKSNLAVRLSLRQLLREMDYSEDQIYDYVPETLEEIDAKMQLMLINRNEKLTPLSADQLREEHEVYLLVFKQSKDTIAKALAIQNRLGMLRKRKVEERKQGMTANDLQGQASNAMNSVRNQVTGDMINKGNQTNSSLNNIQ